MTTTYAKDEMSRYLPLDGWQTEATGRTDSKRLSSTTNNKVANTVLAYAESMGHADIAGFTADCALCGDSLPLCYIEMGHVKPAALGHKMHPAAVVPQCGECNRNLSDMDCSSLLRYDTRPMWDGSLIGNGKNVRVRDTRARWLEH